MDEEMYVVVLPESLRAKLGEDGARDLAELFNVAGRNQRQRTAEVLGERFERRLTEVKTELDVRITEVKADLERRIAEVRADLIKWMFIFWIGQVAATAGIVGLLVRGLR